MTTSFEGSIFFVHCCIRGIYFYRNVWKVEQNYGAKKLLCQYFWGKQCAKRLKARNCSKQLSLIRRYVPKCMQLTIKKLTKNEKTFDSKKFLMRTQTLFRTKQYCVKHGKLRECFILLVKLIIAAQKIYKIRGKSNLIFCDFYCKT